MNFLYRLVKTEWWAELENGATERKRCVSRLETSGGDPALRGVSGFREGGSMSKGQWWRTDKMQGLLRSPKRGRGGPVWTAQNILFNTVFNVWQKSCERWDSLEEKQNIPQDLMEKRSLPSPSIGQYWGLYWTLHSSRSSQHARSVLSAFVVLANSHFHRAVSPPARQAKELKWGPLKHIALSYFLSVLG